MDEQVLKIVAKFCGKLDWKICEQKLGEKFG